MAGEWEESVVLVEFHGVTSQQLVPSNESGILQAEILGIASDQPVMQINGHTFAGHYEDTVGCNLIMEKKEGSTTVAESSSKAKSQDGSVEFFCKTDKKLVMQPAFLVDKASGNSAQTFTETDAAVSEKASPSEQDHS